MSQAPQKIKEFTELLAWKSGHKLVLSIYRLTKQFPTDERFALTQQIRRAAVSVTSNIAEGFGRYALQEKRHFYSIASGSIAEVQNQLIVAHDIGYLERGLFQKLIEESRRTHRLIHGLRLSIKEKRP